MEDVTEQVPDTTFHLHVQSHRAANSGRAKYTKEEDEAIRQYVERVSSDEYAISGNRLWREMEENKVTNRSWSSMRDRYLKYIRERPYSPIQNSENEPDSSCSDVLPTRERKSKRTNATLDDNLPTSSTDTQQPSAKVVRGNNHAAHDDDTASGDSPSSTTNEFPKRPESAQVFVRDGVGSADGASTNRAIQSKNVCFNDTESGTGGSANDGSLSQFDENLLKLAESTDGDVSDSIREESDPTDSWSGFKTVMGNLSVEQLSVLESVRVLRCQQVATLAEIFYSLFRTNGSVRSALDYFEMGYTENFWSFEDDQVLLSQDEEAIAQLADSRGIPELENRISFLNGSSGDTGDGGA